MTPGYLHRIERLNYRAGYMIRPFDLDDNTFEDLVIGNGTYIDAPVRPEPIYHTINGSNTHDNQGGNNNNQFASKIFITSPLEDTYEESGRSKMFICDPTFEYPDITHQIETMRIDGLSGTNAWNGSYKSSTPILFGKIVTHSSTSATTTGTHKAAFTYPYITIDPAECTDTHGLLALNSKYRHNPRK